MTHDYLTKFKHLLPVILKKVIRRTVKNKYWYLLSKKTSPLSNYCGFDRGTPLDRYYIERFLEIHKESIKGRCLELLNNHYSLFYGGTKVTQSDILDIDTSNTHATLYGDLRDLKEVDDNTYDCIIITQVLQFIDNVDKALSECHRILKPGGVLLATVPSVSRIDPRSGIAGDFWRFTEASCKYLFTKYFSNIKITSYGNTRIGIYSWIGLAQEEVSPHILDKTDPNFPVLISIYASKEI